MLADWNGLMIAALANGGALLGETGWIDMAARAFGFIAAEMTRGDRLGHSWRAGRLLFPGLASDFACMIKAALALYEATGERRYLDQALAWQRALDRHYANPDNGGYFLTADDAEGLVVRPAATHDDATPNPNCDRGRATWCGSRCSSGDDAWREKADRLIDGVLGAAGRKPDRPCGAAQRARPAAARRRDRRDRLGRARRRARRRRAQTLVPRSHRAARTGLPAPCPPSHPARDKIAAAPDGAAFVCVGERCSLPVTTADSLARPSARCAAPRSSRSKLRTLPGQRDRRH